MALKHKSIRKPKSKKGVLLTLLTIIIFILMLGEVITYVVLNINYDNLSASVAQSLASGNFAQNLDSGMNAFLYSSLSKSISIITAFESTPTLRNGNFINDSTQTISTLLYNGTLYSNTIAYYNNSFQKAVKEFEAEALTDGFSANLSNITLRIKQSSPFRVGVYVTGLAALNTSSGISLDYPINANTTSSINSKPSLIGAEQGLNGTLQEAQLPKATVVGNITAVSGSMSPYMFAYGKVIYISGEPICSDVATQYTNGNYILATPNAADIGQNVCGMAGLITNISNSSTPLKPYLVYKNDSIMSYLQSDPNLLIDGAGLDLLNTSAIQSSAVGGFYYPSPYTASYLQRAEGKPYLQSPEGIFSFRSTDRGAAYFNGASNIITTLPIASTYNFTVVFWVKPTSLSKIESGNGYTLFNSGGTNNFEMWLNDGGGPSAAAGTGDEEVGFGSNFYHAYGVGNSSWSFVAVSVSNSIGTLYVNNKPAYKISIVGGPYSLEDFAIGQSAQSISQLNGSIANVQVYNSSLSSYQISSLYMQGINDIPINGSKLAAWYPLDSNANDYSGNGKNGVPTNVIYTGITGYTSNPTEQQQQNYISKLANFNGSNSYIDLGNPSDLQFGSGNTITVYAWVNIHSCTADGTSGAAVVGHGSDSYTFYVSPVNSACNLEWAESTVANIGTGPAIPENKWVNIVAVNNIGKNVTLYIDGVEYGPYSFTNTYSYTEDLRIGSSQSDTNQFIFNGSISNVQIYGSGLTNSEIQQLYLSGMHTGPVENASLVGWWPLDGNANDYSDNGNSGTAYYVSYMPQELPASTSPVKGVLGCDSMSSCNSSSQRLYLSGLPLESAGLGYMNASTSLGMLNGVVPAALQFSGSSYIDAPLQDYFSTANSISASVWTYVTPNTNGNIFSIVGSSGTETFIKESGLTISGLSSNVVVTAPGWYNIISVFNSSSSTAYVYVDGSGSSGSFTYSAVGSSPQWETQSFNGEISGVQLYASGLTPAQAEQLYQNNSISSIAPEDYWPLGEGNGNLLNETENIMNATDYGYLYNSASVACTNSQVINGNCGVSYVPG